MLVAQSEAVAAPPGRFNLRLGLLGPVAPGPAALLSADSHLQVPTAIFRSPASPNSIPESETRTPHRPCAQSICQLGILTLRWLGHRLDLFTVPGLSCITSGRE